MTKRGEVLVAIVNNLNDFADLRDHHWYRIPVVSVDKWLKDRFPPEWIAFYQTKKFGAEAHAINYVAKVLEVKQVYRHEIFPDEPIGEKTNKKLATRQFEIKSRKTAKPRKAKHSSNSFGGSGIRFEKCSSHGGPSDRREIANRDE